MYIFDAHNDTLLKLLKNECDTELGSLENTHVNLDKLLKGNIKMAIFAIYVPKSYRFGLNLHQALLMVDIFWENLQKYQKHLTPILTVEDLVQLRDTNQIGCLLSLEGGEVLEGNLAHLRNLYRLGVRALTLTWNHRNQLADGVGEGQYAQGLSSFGYQVVEVMNELGMLIDVSHLAEKGFWQVLEASKAPIIASHSNSRTLCNHPRNLSDQQIKALADHGGVVGVNFYPYFLKEPSTTAVAATIEDVVEQILYLLNVGGEDCVGLGSDFDGIDITPTGLEDISKVPRLIDLLSPKLSEEVIEKVMFKNFFRVTKEIFSKSS